MHSLPKITSSATSATDRSSNAGRARPLFGAALLVLVSAMSAAAQDAGSPPRAADPALVRVQIFRTFVPKGAGETVVINGHVIPNYRPTIIEAFPATGVVLDDAGHVLAFLGYRWVELYEGEIRIEIVDPSEAPPRKLGGKLVGIDQSTGVAVIRAAARGLRKTPLCAACSIQHGATVVAPVAEPDGGQQFESARIVAIGEAGAEGVRGLQLRFDRRLRSLGEPLLDAEHRVLGFVTAQKTTPDENVAATAVVYPMSQLLTSAEKIIEAGTDICTGWLGVYLHDGEASPSSSGVRIRSVVPGGPAARAGLQAEDVVVAWKGTPVRSPRELIRFVQDTAAGSKAAVGILRGGRPRTIEALVGTRRPEDNRALIVELPAVISPDSGAQAQVTLGTAPDEDRPKLGVDIVPLSPELASSLEIPAPSGLLVSSVHRNLPAARAGVQAGDVILSVDGLRIFDPIAFAMHIHARGWGSTVVLRYLRKKTEHIARITLRRAFGRQKQ